MLGLLLRLMDHIYRIILFTTAFCERPWFVCLWVWLDVSSFPPPHICAKYCSCRSVSFLILLSFNPSTSCQHLAKVCCSFDSSFLTTEPAHEIMVVFVLRKLILQTRMRSHSVGLDVWFLVGPFVYFDTLCVRTANRLGPRNFHLSLLMRLWYLSHRRPAKVQASLRIHAVSQEPSLFAHMKYGTRRRVGPKQTSSPTGWLRMCVWRMSVRRTKNAIIT